MNRHVLSTVVAGLIAAAVGAETPNALQPGQRSELYKKNRLVIEGLLKNTIESSKTPNDHLKRADAYYAVLLQFSNEIRLANGSGESDRAAELTGHLTTLLKDGLAPTLDKAKKQVEGGSGVDEFPRVKDNLLSQITVLEGQLDPASPAGSSLGSAKAKVNAITIPEKK
jgi:hypothetical protein